MHNKQNLLEMKRNIIALSLAGACALSLTGCNSDNNNSLDTDNDTSITDTEPDRKDAVVCFFEDYAVIAYAEQIRAYDKTIKDTRINAMGLVDYNFAFPSTNAYVINATASFTPEEFVISAKGPDFPINYLNSEENLTR